MNLATIEAIREGIAKIAKENWIVPAQNDYRNGVTELHQRIDNYLCELIAENGGEVKEPEPEIPWEKLEGWVQWVAMDRRGAWYEYQVQPKRLSTCWGPVCGLCKASLLIQFTAVDWSTSLHKRPDPAVNDKLAGALRQILDIRFAEYPDGDESAPYKIITRMHRIAQNALK